MYLNQANPSFENKNSLNTYKKILNWKTFMNIVGFIKK